MRNCHSIAGCGTEVVGNAWPNFSLQLLGVSFYVDMFTHRMAILAACLDLFASATQAPAQFSIRAASVEPVDGWQRMQVEHCQSRCFLWISPTANIVASDIERAQPEVRPKGDT